jgi:hypothetical protein
MQNVRSNYESIELAALNDIDVSEDQKPVDLNDQQKGIKNEDKIKCDSRSTSNGLELHVNQDGMNKQTKETTVMKSVNAINVGSMSKNQRVVDAVSMKQNQLHTTTINDIDTDLGPIVGYAAEPLLPLAKACAPLIDIIHDLSVYVQMALDETPDVPPDGLTVDESAAIRLYTIEWKRPHRSLYSMLNHTLKKDNREHLRPYFKYMKLFLSALAKLPCAPQSTVWRGVTKNASAEFPPGTQVTWWAFTSCTTELTVLENNMYLGNTGNRTLFSVEAINGRTVRDHSHFVSEDEILLFPGTYMIVQSQFSPASDLHIIHLKQEIPKEVLLEPPFEGDLNSFNHSF